MRRGAFPFAHFDLHRVADVDGIYRHQFHQFPAAQYARNDAAEFQQCGYKPGMDFNQASAVIG
jgi:hypothetical protein